MQKRQINVEPFARFIFKLQIFDLLSIDLLNLELKKSIHKKTTVSRRRGML